MSGQQNISDENGEIDVEQEQLNPEGGQDLSGIDSADEVKEEANEGVPDTESLIQEIEVQKQLAEEYQEKALRAQAEMDNLRKRTLRDIENAHKYALEKFMAELLPVVDSMELGISATDNAENLDDLRKGMDLTLKMLVTCMEKFGIVVIDPQGEKFNPELHEAISMLAVEEAESGTVTTVVQKGYELNGRLVRPAMVVVAK